VKELGRKLHRISPILIMPALDAGIFLNSEKKMAGSSPATMKL
jgi:hypothetical protein